MSRSNNNSFRFGISNSSCRCSLVVLSNDDIIVKVLLSKVIDANLELYGNRYQINVVLPLSSTVRSGEETNGDYIVIAVNPCRTNWNEEVENIIGMISEEHRFGRFCLAIDTSSSLGSSMLDMRRCLDIIKKKYSCLLLFGEFNRDEIMDHMAKRLLRHVNNVSCNSYGLPIPTILSDIRI